MSKLVGLSAFTIFWFLMSFVTVCIDAAFVLGRPGTLTTDQLPFTMWQLYAQHDRRYGDMKDAFVIAQSYVNFIEVGLQLLAVILHFTGARSAALCIAIAVSMATCLKTVLYGLMEEFDGHKFTKHNSTVDLWTMVIIPSSFWVMIPIYVIINCMGKLQAKPAAAAKISDERKRK